MLQHTCILILFIFTLLSEMHVFYSILSYSICIACSAGGLHVAVYIYYRIHVLQGRDILADKIETLQRHRHKS
jgi:hypothetical protein